MITVNIPLPSLIKLIDITKMTASIFNEICSYPEGEALTLIYELMQSKGYDYPLKVLSELGLDSDVESILDEFGIEKE